MKRARFSGKVIEGIDRGNRSAIHPYRPKMGKNRNQERVTSARSPTLLSFGAKKTEGGKYFSGQRGGG